MTARPRRILRAVPPEVPPNDDVDQEAYDAFVGHFEDTLGTFDPPDRERQELVDASHGFHEDDVTAE